MHDNERGYHHPNKVNQATPATCDTPTPLSQNVGIGSEMGPGILGAPLNPDPHARGFKMPVHIAPETRRPRDEPTAMTPPHDPAPHPANAAGQKQQVNTY